MDTPATQDFYAALPAHALSPSELLSDPGRFAAVPPDWHVLVTDVKGSTELVAAGRHEVINLVATGSIIAAINIASARDLEIPFFFGGDGATILLPSVLLDAVRNALVEHRRNTARNFTMDLRVGAVSVARINAAGHVLRIAKLARDGAFSLPIAVGEGLAFAERAVKGEDLDPEAGPGAHDDLDLDGMECRWDRVAPPRAADEVVCLLVNITGQAKPESTMQQVLSLIDRCYGSRQRRNPITSEKLRLDRSFTAINKETRAKLGRFDWRYAVEHWLRTAVIGPSYLRFAADGQAYAASVPNLSETLTIDGRINTVISGTRAQRLTLTKKLDELERGGVIIYGLYASNASILSCYVRNRHDQHIHFIDGSDGGYTNAAKMLKAKQRGKAPDQAAVCSSSLEHVHGAHGE